MSSQKFVNDKNALNNLNIQPQEASKVTSSRGKSVLMLPRIREAIQVANNPTSDAVSKKQAIEYLNEIKHDPNVVQWVIALLNDLESDQMSKFVALQILSDIVTTPTNVSLENIMFIKDSILTILKDKINRNDKDPEYMRNKIAELITRLFLLMYSECNGNQWNTFFMDLYAILQINSLLDTYTLSFSTLGLDYLLRICIYINSEIADQTFIRSKEIQLKNNCLKDQMRANDVQLLVNIWINSLRYVLNDTKQNVDSNLMELTTWSLSCIGSYISWIDVNLIITPEYINLIYNFLDYNETKIACSNCLCEIITKKMKPSDKLSLLSLLNLTDKLNTIDHNDDLDIHENLAKLASTIGLELSLIIEQCQDTIDSNKNNNNNNTNNNNNNNNNNDSIPHDTTSDMELQQVSIAADQRTLNQCVPLILKFMSHEYDSVTQQCFPFVTQYLSVLKKLFAIGGKPGSAVLLNSKKQPLDQDHSNFLVTLMSVMFKKMRIDESSDEESQDDIDEFNETIRSKLKTFQESICVINPQIFVENISNMIESLLTSTNNNPNVNWRDLELCLWQMNNLCETIRNNMFGVPKQEIITSPPALIMFKFMNLLLNNTSIFHIDNSYVEISFFELIVRHHTFINGEKEHFTLLNIFCSEFGMFNKRERVRIRSWYLFTRFIKMIKPKYSISILTEIITKVSPLLTIKITSMNPDGTENDTTFDNQMYLFEGIGLLIGANSETNYDILDNVLKPMFTQLESCISSQVQTPEVVLQCHHILMAIGTLARGVHGGLVPENQVNNALVNKRLIHQSLVEKFSNIAEVVLVTLSFFNKHENIRDASRFTFSRLIPILNSGIVPFANKLIALFLESDLKMLELNDFLGFLGQMIHTFNKDENCLQLFTTLLTPIVNKVHQMMTVIENEAITQNMQHNANGVVATSGASAIETKDIHNKNIIVTDSFRDKVLLKKAYFAFLQSFVTNNVTSLLLAPINGNALSIILTDLLTYTPAEIQETSAMKLALNVLVNFIKYFGSGKCNDPKDPHAMSVQKVEGLNEFFISKVVPLVFEVPFNPEYKFNVKEGTYRIVACDLSRLLKELYLQSIIDPSNPTDINSNPLLKYLSQIYLPQIQFPDQLTMELIEMLVTQDQKTFEKYYVTLIDRLMS